MLIGLTDGLSLVVNNEPNRSITYIIDYCRQSELRGVQDLFTFSVLYIPVYARSCPFMPVYARPCRLCQTGPVPVYARLDQYPSMPGQSMPGQTMPSQAVKAKPSQAKPVRAKPSQSKPGPVNARTV